MRNIVSILTGSLMLVACSAAAVSAHDWYPLDCCSGMDCAPVDKAVLGYPEGGMMLTSKHGTVQVSPEFPTRPSQDSRMHVCMRASGPATMRAICLFVPPAM